MALKSDTRKGSRSPVRRSDYELDPNLTVPGAVTAASKVVIFAPTVMYSCMPLECVL